MYKGLVPNIITLSRLLLTPIIVYTIVQHQWVLSIIFFLIAASTDLLDGFFARRLNQVTRLGAYLDPIADKVLVVSTFMAVSVVSRCIPSAFLYFIILREFILVSGGCILWMSCIRKGYLAPSILAPSFFGKLTMVVQTLVLIFALICLSLAQGMLFLITNILSSIVVVLSIGSFVQYAMRIISVYRWLPILMLFIFPLHATTDSRSVVMIEAQDIMIKNELIFLMQVISTKDGSVRQNWLESKRKELFEISEELQFCDVMSSLQLITQAITTFDSCLNPNAKLDSAFSSYGADTFIEAVLFLAIFRSCRQTVYASIEQFLHGSGIPHKRVMRKIGSYMSILANYRFSILISVCLLVMAYLGIKSWYNSFKAWLDLTRNFAGTESVGNVSPV